MTRTGCAAWGMIILLLCGISLGEPLPQTPVSYNIRSQPLQDALRVFADQSGYQLLFLSKVAGDAKSAPVAGLLTAEAALSQLLAKSGLRYQFINAHTVTIRTEDGRLGSTKNISDASLGRRPQ